MTKENQDRLDFLRSLPYADYLLTPEWEATRKQALTRVSHRCQICMSDDESVEVYHKTTEHLGAERERDLMVLCSACHGVLSRAGKLVERQAPLPHFSLAERLRIAGPTALIGVGLPTLLHAPLPAELAGVGLAVYLFMKFPHVYTGLRESLPEPVMDALDGLIRRKEERKAAGEWSVGDRLLGRHLTAQERMDTQEEAMVPEAEEPAGEEAIQPPPEAVDDAPTLTMPRAPRFREMAHLLTNTSELILCYTTTGPVYGTIRDLLSMAVVGKPGRGKTTALMYYATILLAAGAEIHVWDPHGSLSELCDMHPWLFYTDMLDDLPASIARLRSALEERATLFRISKQTVHPLLLLVDELPVIGDYEKYLKRKGIPEEQTPTFLIKRFVLEARKWNGYFIGSGQSTDAEILPTRVTENLSSRIVFYSSDRRARMAGLEQEDVKRFLPLLKRAEPGVMVFDCSRFNEPVLGAIPEITASDIQTFFAERGELQAQTPTQNQQAGTPDALTVEMLLGLLKQADIDVNSLQQQQPSHDRGNEQVPTVRMRPVPGQQEQRAKFLWSQRTGMQDLLLSREHTSSEEQKAAPAPIVLPERKRKAEDIDLPTAVMIWNAVLPSVREMEEIFNLNNHQARKLRELILKQPQARQPEGEDRADEELSE
jgi:hypothetical protein